MSLSSSTLMGIIGAIVMFMGTRQILAGKLTLGGFFTYTMFLGYLAAPLFQVVGIGTQITEAIAGLERTREVLDETPENEDPGRTVALGEIRGDLAFQDVNFAYEQEKTVLHDVSFHAQPGTVTALVGSSGSGKSTIIGLIAAFHKPNEGEILVDGVDLAKVRLESYRTQLGMVLQDSFLFDGSHSRERRLLQARRHRSRDSARLRHRACRRVRGEVRAEIRHHHRRARREAVRRPAPARLHRPRHPRQPAHPDSRRSHLQPRLRIGSADPARPLLPDAGPHDLRHRPPPVDHSPRRPDPGRRRRPHRRARHAPVRSSISAAATTSSTPSSTASSRISSSRPAKATASRSRRPPSQIQRPIPTHEYCCDSQAAVGSGRAGLQASVPAYLHICHPDRGLQPDRGICGSSRGAAPQAATHSLQASVQMRYSICCASATGR